MFKFKSTKTNKLSISELNHHSIHGLRSRALAQALPAPKKRWNSSSQKPWFTIIEVVLVLAIAGLIFLMVFIALPALQRNQRDTRRKQDADRILAAIQSFQANNRDRVPGDGSFFRGEFTDRYMKAGGDEFRTPTGQNYSFSVDATRTVESMVSHDYRLVTVWVWHNGGCDGETPVRRDGYNKVAIAAVLEGGGIYCINN